MKLYVYVPSVPGTLGEFVYEGSTVAFNQNDDKTLSVLREGVVVAFFSAGAWAFASMDPMQGNTIHQ